MLLGSVDLSHLALRTVQLEAVFLDVAKLFFAYLNDRQAVHKIVHKSSLLKLLLPCRLFRLQ